MGSVDGGFADDELLDLLEDAATAVGDDRSEDEIKQQLAQGGLKSLRVAAVSARHFIAWGHLG